MLIIDRLEIPLPPSVNNYWISSRGKHKFLSDKARKFREDVIIILKDKGLYELNNNQRIKYTCELHFKDKRKRDIDNFHKGILDSLTASKVILDDSQVDIMKVYRKDLDINKVGFAIITLEEILI